MPGPVPAICCYWLPVSTHETEVDALKADVAGEACSVKRVTEPAAARRTTGRENLVPTSRRHDAYRVRAIREPAQGVQAIAVSDSRLAADRDLPARKAHLIRTHHTVAV